ncbi:hypothetical protein Golax_004071 [Gossypium laxum]|uniref:Zinc knuckle CX2CX4HX4C domain-containing protein n=1 Tax=Gossypium laxum TaxID=34288 RepID=A0A7J9AHJ7_9ROSI|nr:hypothetical protein [Gossypium laxum]
MRGNFARIAISVDLRHPLVSKIMIENHVQRVEHEAMSNIFVSCGRYGHLKELCPANRNRAEDGAPMQSSSPEMMKNKQTATEKFAPIIGSQLNSVLDLIAAKQRENGPGAKSAIKAARKKPQAYLVIKKLNGKTLAKRMRSKRDLNYGSLSRWLIVDITVGCG